MTNEITPNEGGTMRFTNLEKEFVGKDGVLRAMDSNPRITICYVEVDVPMGAENAADVAGGEPCFNAETGEVIGLTTSGGYGHTVGKSLAFAYVSPEFAEPGKSFEIEILGDKRKATVLAEPAYDPSASRSRI